MAEFPVINPNEANAPTNSSSLDRLGLLNPDDVLSGTLRGTQNVGGPGLSIDSSNRRITLSANDVTLKLGDLSDNNSTTGLSVANGSGNTIIQLGTFADSTKGFSFYDDSNIRRLHLGTYPDGTVKAKLSKNTFDVSTATNDQLIWSSDFNNFKIVRSATTTIPAANLGVSGFQADSIVISHGLTFIPILQPYCLVNYTYGIATSSFNVIPAYVPLPYNGIVGLLPSTNVNNFYISAAIDSANIYFSWVYGCNSSGGYNFPAVLIRYYLLQETVN